MNYYGVPFSEPKRVNQTPSGLEMQMRDGTWICVPHEKWAKTASSWVAPLSLVKRLWDEARQNAAQ